MIKVLIILEKFDPSRVSLNMPQFYHKVVICIFIKLIGNNLKLCYLYIVLTIYKTDRIQFISYSRPSPA